MGKPILTTEMAEYLNKVLEQRRVQTRQQIYDEAMAMFETALNKRLDRLQGKESLILSFQIHIIGKDGKVKHSSPRATHTAEYRRWRKAVLERDNQTCQECGSHEHLQVHHIKAWAKHPELRFEISNGKTLCRDCHAKIHPHMMRFKRE